MKKQSRSWQVFSTVFLTSFVLSPFVGTVPSALGSETEKVDEIRCATGTPPHDYLVCRKITPPAGVEVVLHNVTAKPEGITITGWGYDPATPQPLLLFAFIESIGSRFYVADNPLEWFPIIYPGTGTDHGFSVTIPFVTPVAPGDHQACVYKKLSDEPLACKTVNIPDFSGGNLATPLNEACASGLPTGSLRPLLQDNRAAVEACVRALASGVTVTVDWTETLNSVNSKSGWAGQVFMDIGHQTAAATLTNSVATTWGLDNTALSLAMHEAGHAASVRCPTIAADPLFDPQPDKNQRVERFGTAFAIAHGAPSRWGSGEGPYKFRITNAEIELASRC